MYNVKIKEWYGRLGNNLAQLANAIHFAKKTNSILNYPPHPIIQDKTFFFQDSKIVDPKLITEDHNKIPEHEFIFFTDTSAVYKKFGIKRNFDSNRIFQTYLLPLLPYNDFDLIYDIVIHLRGGDVFKQQDNKSLPFHYIQSPLSYFSKILEREKPNKVLLVAEDENNPILEMLLQSEYNCFFSPHSLKEDINFLLNAKKLIVGGITTFSGILAEVSLKLEKVYLPVYEGNALPRMCRTHEIKDEVNYPACEYVYHKNYIIRDDWKLNNKQKKLLKEHHMTNIHFISDLDTNTIEKWEKIGKLKYKFQKKFLYYLSFRFILDAYLKGIYYFKLGIKFIIRYNKKSG